MPVCVALSHVPPVHSNKVAHIVLVTSNMVYILLGDCTMKGLCMYCTITCC